MQPLYLCIHLRDFATLALTVSHFCEPQANVGHPNKDGIERAPLLPSIGKSGSGAAAAVAILSGEPPLERVFALNSAARALGLTCGMSRLQAESFPAMIVRRNPAQEEHAFAILLRCAEHWSPRIEIVASPAEQSCGATLLLDVSGSQRLLGSPQQIASAVYRAVCDLPHIRQQQANVGDPSHDELSVAVARNADAAVLAARGISGSTVIASGREAATLAALPMSVLELDEEQTQTLDAWGIRTLGQFAALEPRALAARLGQSGARLQAQARGESIYFLVPNEEPADVPICASLELEHPVELLEPLLLLLNQLLEQVIAGAQQRAFAIASVELTLRLEKSTVKSGPDLPGAAAGAVAAYPNAKPASGKCGEPEKVEDHRLIRPALPERERLNLLKLFQLELEMHPPAAPITALRVVAHPARPQTAQQGLFTAQAPEPGKLEILLARLRKLAGEGRVGSPELLDSRGADSFRLTRFAPSTSQVSAAQDAARNLGHPLGREGSITRYSPALRVLRPPRAVGIELRGGSPAVLHDDGQRLKLQTASGPWRTSGEWWTQTAWSREEWDVSLQADPKRLLRLAHDPANRTWYVIGMYD